jgi:hypothetical protein
MLTTAASDLFSITKFSRQRLSTGSIVFSSTRNFVSAAYAVCTASSCRPSSADRTTRIVVSLYQEGGCLTEAVDKLGE